MALSHHQCGTDFGREGGCGGPYLCTPSTSAHAQNRFEFLELSRDMSSNCTGEVQARTGISDWYQLATRIIHVPVYRVRRGSRGSPVCYVLVRTTYKYTFIFQYLAPGALLLLLLLLCAFIYLALMIFCTCCLHDTSSWYQGTRY